MWRAWRRKGAGEGGHDPAYHRPPFRSKAQHPAACRRLTTEGTKLPFPLIAALVCGVARHPKGVGDR